jgi:hypothetical protein
MDIAALQSAIPVIAKQLGERMCRDALAMYRDPATGVSVAFSFHHCDGSKPFRVTLSIEQLEPEIQFLRPDND